MTGVAVRTGPSVRELLDAELVGLMREIFDAAEGAYGVPRMHRELRGNGIVVNEKRVRRLMRLHGMAGRCIRRRCTTTIPGPDGYTIPDLVGRAFTPGKPDVAWCQDITYIHTGEGWLYLASVIDIGSRRMLGYSMADHMRTSLVTNALDMAIAARGGAAAGVIAHADRGSQYTSNDYLDHCQRHQLRPSVGRVATCFDNAVAESFWASLKRECIRGRVFTTRRSPPDDLPMDHLVQHPTAAFQPRLHPTRQVGTAVPSSVITPVRPTGRCPVNPTCAARPSNGSSARTTSPPPSNVFTCRLIVDVSTPRNCANSETRTSPRSETHLNTPNPARSTDTPAAPMKRSCVEAKENSRTIVTTASSIATTESNVR